MPINSRLCGNLIQKAIPRACLQVLDGLSFVQIGKSNPNRPKRLCHGLKPCPTAFLRVFNNTFPARIFQTISQWK